MEQPASRSYTTIERLFHYEIILIKLCGGFMFEWPRFLSITYRTALVIITRLITLNYYATYPERLGSFSKATLQNVKLFWNAYQVIAYATVFTTLFTGIKYHNLILVILRKRLDTCYLTGVRGDGAGGKGCTKVRAPSESFISSSLSSSSISCSSSSTEANFHDDGQQIIGGGGGGDGGVKKQRLDASGDGISSSLLSVSRWSLRPSRVQLVRGLFILNLLLTTTISYIRNHTYDRHQAGKFTPVNLGSPLVAATATTINSTHNVVASTVVKLVANGSAPAGVRSSHSTLFYTNAALGEWIELCVLGLSRAPFDTGQILSEFVQTAMNVNQIYGQIMVVLMITATITDMLKYSFAQDCQTHDHANEPSNRIPSKYWIPDSAGGGGVELSTTTNAHKELPLTTELLVQVRDVLLVLRCTMSLDYLMILIFDLSRLMSVFCMLNAVISTGKTDAIVLICIDYTMLAFNMILTRLGYHWLHNEVEKLKRRVDERNMLLEAASNTSKYSESYNGSALNQSERITTYRLADDIKSIWPTDWFTPDLRTYLKHNIFVITFVATLQQLVEAGSKVDYQGSLTMTQPAEK